MKKISLFILILATLLPVAVKAQEYKLLEPLPCIAGTSTGGNCATTPKINLNDYIGYIFKFSIALAAFLAVIMIIWGGVQYMTSEVPFLKLEGKGKIGGAIAGLVMVLASYLILATIDPRLVEINTSIPPIVKCDDKIKTNCIDTAGVDKFKNTLNSDLSKLSVESQQTIADSNNKIDALQKQRDALSNSEDIKNGNVTEEVLAEYTKLTQQINSERSKMIQSAVIDQASTIFLNTINNPDAIYATYRDASSKISSVLTAEKIQSLKDLGDFAGAQKLISQQAFFTKELNEQGLFDGNIRDGTTRNIQAELNTYKKQYADMVSVGPSADPYVSNIKTDSALAPIFTNMLSARIKRAQDVLGITPAK